MAIPNHETIRLIRMGNGKARAVPSPKELSPGMAFVIKNWTACEADVDFAGVPVTPQKRHIGDGDSGDFTVDSEPQPGYYEYQISLVCEGPVRPVNQYVEGGSRPGLIIDR